MVYEILVCDHIEERFSFLDPKCLSVVVASFDTSRDYRKEFLTPFLVVTISCKEKRNAILIVEHFREIVSISVGRYVNEGNLGKIASKPFHHRLIEIGVCNRCRQENHALGSPEYVPQISRVLDISRMFEENLEMKRERSHLLEEYSPER